MRGDTVQIRLVGVNADNRADGKGKAGLTFMTTTYVGGNTSMADTDHSIGGYRDVRIRKDFNEGKYKNTINNNVYNYLTPVLKIQNNQSSEEMNNLQHSATSNATVEKVSIPSPLELNMNVTRLKISGDYKNGFTPSGLVQYNPYLWWQSFYSYLYSGNAPYKYYQNNTSNVSEYCKLVKGDGTLNTGDHHISSIDSDSCKTGKKDYIWLRSPFSTNTTFYIFTSDFGGTSGNSASDSHNHYYYGDYNYHSVALLSF